MEKGFNSLAPKKLGLVINPIAGMGGSVGLKGTDGLEILKKARSLGAKPLAEKRAKESLEKITVLKGRIEVLTFPDRMGEKVALECGFNPKVIGSVSSSFTTAEDTRRAASELVKEGTDLILFAGGDGTARDICEVVGRKVVVLGIPAGVKIHSASFAANPEKAGELAVLYLDNQSRRTIEAEVMDLNEDDYRRGVLSAQLVGYLKIPFERRLLQSLKSGTPASERYYQESIATDITKNMTDEHYYAIGPGSTTRHIMEKLELDYTLLGIDVIFKKQLIGKDLNEAELINILNKKKAKLIITPIGGQGYILGRGNQQINPEVIRLIKKDNIIIVATHQKINALCGRPLLVDCGDSGLNKKLSDYYRIVTGYREYIIYKVSG
jgi:predicted polyphosphate/ATP-dependent NAD kinase